MGSHAICGSDYFKECKLQIIIYRGQASYTGICESDSTLLFICKADFHKTEISLVLSLHLSFNVLCVNTFKKILYGE